MSPTMSDDTGILTLASPLGPLTVHEKDGAITRVKFGASKEQRVTPLLETAKAQLDAYFYCGLKNFDLPLAPDGSAFEQEVWETMLEIPYGRTLTYGQIATKLGGMAQAVGGACGSNPIPIIIPCHRVLAAGDRIGGYSGAGGTETKTFLLQLEGALLL